MNGAPDTAARISLKWLGVIGCAGYATHAGYHILNGTPQDTIWICHIAALLAGLALLFRSPKLNAAGLLCLTIGLPMWVLYLFSGEPFIWTSPLTHVLGLVIATTGAKAFGGIPRHSWMWATLFVAVMMVAARLFTPAEANVNLAFGPMAGLSLWQVSGAAHWALQLASWAVALAVLEQVWRKILGTTPTVPQ